MLGSYVGKKIRGRNGPRRRREKRPGGSSRDVELLSDPDGPEEFSDCLRLDLVRLLHEANIDKIDVLLVFCDGK